MRKFLASLFVLAVAACTKEYHYHYDNAGNEIPDPSGVVEEPVSSTDGSITVNIIGPENWFGNAGPSLTGKGTPSEEYSKGPYTVELYSVVDNVKERVAYVRDIYTEAVEGIEDSGNPPVFDADDNIEAGVTYEVRVFPNIDTANNKYEQMWDKGFKLEGVGSIEFIGGGGDAVADVQIRPTHVSQLSVTGNAYKVTFRQWMYKPSSSTWYHYNHNNLQWAKVDDISFTAPHTDSSVYWNLAGVPDTADLFQDSGATEAYTSVPASYTNLQRGMIQVTVQPSEYSDDVLHYWVAKEFEYGVWFSGLPTDNGDFVFSGENKNFLAAEVNKNYTLNFDTYTNEFSVNIIEVVVGITDAESDLVDVDIEIDPFEPKDEKRDNQVRLLKQADWDQCVAGASITQVAGRATGSSELSDDEKYRSVPMKDGSGYYARYNRTDDTVELSASADFSTIDQTLTLDEEKNNRVTYKTSNGNNLPEFRVHIRNVAETGAFTPACPL